MFYSKQLNNQINKIQERALRLVYKDNKLTFDDPLKLDDSVLIHQWNLQILEREIFKVKNSLASENVKSTHYGIQSVQHVRPKM